VLRTILESTSDMIYMKDCKGRYVSVNAAAAINVGKAAEDIVGRTDLQIFPPETAAQIMEIDRCLLADGATVSYDQVYPVGAGTSCLAAVKSVCRDASGKVIGVVGISRDLSARRRAEDALRASEAKFRSLFEASRDAIILLDERGFFDCNQAAVDLFEGSSKAQVVSHHPSDLSPPVQPDGRASSDVAQELIQGAFREGSRFFEWTHRRMDGTDFPAEVLLSRFEFDGRHVLQAVVRDITLRKWREESLRRLQKAVETTGDVVFMTDTSGTFTYVNPAFARLYGYALGDFVGKATPRILKHPDTDPRVHELLWQTLQSKAIFRGEVTNQGKDGRVVTVEVSVSCVLNETGEIEGYLGVQRDIAERKRSEAERIRLESQLRHSQKLETIGTLAGGIAHDFNILVRILVFSDMVDRSLGKDHPPMRISWKSSKAPIVRRTWCGRF
jgi:PAS domain S-box-containing protein